MSEKLKLDLKYKKNTVYAVTIQPDDKHQYFRSPTRFSKFLDHMNSLLVPLISSKIDFYFIIELSEPIGTVTGQGSRLHLHGVINLKATESVYRFLLNHLSDFLLCGRLEISEVHDLDAWWTYIHKQKTIFKNHDNTLSNFLDQEYAHRNFNKIFTVGAENK